MEFCSREVDFGGGTIDARTGSPGKGGVTPDAETAEAQVAEAHQISDALRDRLVAVREDW